jgi:tRNA (guanine37-N1)-methyltransferase
LANLDRVVLVCGRYEGVDERVAEHLATDEISIGDFVLSGGELAAAMILDAVTRLIPGALGNEDSSVNESFSESGREIDLVQEGRAAHTRGRDAAGTRLGSNLRVAERGILDFPHYTRPQSFRGWEVPEVLISGNHQQIRRWRAEKALEKTLRNRPDLFKQLPR